MTTKSELIKEAGDKAIAAQEIVLAMVQNYTDEEFLKNRENITTLVARNIDVIKMQHRKLVELTQ